MISYYYLNLCFTIVCASTLIDDVKSLKGTMKTSSDIIKTINNTNEISKDDIILEQNISTISKNILDLISDDDVEPEFNRANRKYYTFCKNYCMACNSTSCGVNQENEISKSILKVLNDLKSQKEFESLFEHHLNSFSDDYQDSKSDELFKNKTVDTFHSTSNSQQKLKTPVYGSLDFSNLRYFLFSVIFLVLGLLFDTLLQSIFIIIAVLILILHILFETIPYLKINRFIIN